MGLLADDMRSLRRNGIFGFAHAFGKRTALTGYSHVEPRFLRLILSIVPSFPISLSMK